MRPSEGAPICAQEFHHGGRYYKGKGKEFWEWLKDTYPSEFVMHFERAEGGRQVSTPSK